MSNFRKAIQRLIAFTLVTKIMELNEIAIGKKTVSNFENFAGDSYLN